MACLCGLGVLCVVSPKHLSLQTSDVKRSIVFPTSRTYARIACARISSGVSSSRQCERPFGDAANSMTAGISAAISVAS